MQTQWTDTPRARRSGEPHTADKPSGRIRSQRWATVAGLFLGASATTAPAGSLSPSPDFQPRVTNEHVDIGIAYDGGAWDLHVHDENNDAEYAPDEVLNYVGPAARTSRPAGSAFDFIGVAAGATYHRLPQSQNSSLLYLGIAAEEVAPGTFDSYNPSTQSKQRLPNVAASYLRLSLVSVKGYGGATAPGHFSIWSSADEGPIVYMSSFNDGIANANANGLDATDGITADDALWIVEGSHSHFNYGFSATGLYELTFEASGYLNDGNAGTLGTQVFSGPVTYTFGVETTAVPEPATFGGAVLTLVGLLARRRRKIHWGAAVPTAMQASGGRPAPQST